MRQIRFLILILSVACFALVVNAEKVKVPIKETPKKVIDPNIPHAPPRATVEVWLENSLLTILFHNPEGEAVVTLTNEDGSDSVEFFFPTEDPIIIDLTPYGEVLSFTIKTDTGKTYIGYL